MSDIENQAKGKFEKLVDLIKAHPTSVAIAVIVIGALVVLRLFFHLI